MLNTFIIVMKYNQHYYFVVSAEIRSDEFWDYEHQVDLEAFDSKRLYEILSAQSKKTTQDLAKQKEEVHL